MNTIGVILTMVITLSFNPFLKGQEGMVKLSAILESASSTVPDDQVYLHTDRNLYHPDDTIFFQSYVRNRFTQVHETSSISLYVILTGEEGNVIDSARFRIDHSLAPGYLKIPNYITPGYYRLVAFTSKMQDFDPDYAFTTWLRIDVLSSDGVSTDFLFDKPSYSSRDTAEINIILSDNLGEPLTNEPFKYSVVLDGESQAYYSAKTNRQGEALLRIYLPDSIQYRRLSLEVNLKEKNHLSRISIPRDSDIPNLKFLPEGGTLINDYSQRLAFNAVTDNGKQVYISGTIKDELGNTIEPLKSGNYGPGLIELTPAEGHTYHAVLDGYPGIKFPLPLAEESGLSMRVDVFRNLVNIRVNEKSMPEDSCFLVLSMNNDIITIMPVNQKENRVFAFDTDVLPAGTLIITLYDNRSNPVAERPVLINSHKETLVELNSKYDFYVGGQETEIEISFKDNQGKGVAGIFSVAVIDSLTAFYPDLPWMNIKESFLFDNDFYNNLPGRIRINGLSSIPAADIDLLMMTYGWRKYNLTGTGQPVKDIENYDLISVRILDRMSKRRTRLMDTNKDNLVVMTVEYPGIYSLLSGNDGLLYFPFDSLGPFNNRIIVAPGNNSERYINGVKIEFRNNESYLNSLRGSIGSPPITLTDDFSVSNDPGIDLDSIKNIGAVNVWGKRTREKMEEDMRTLQTVSSSTLEQKDIKFAVSLDQLLRRLNPLYLDTGAEQIFFRPQQSLLGGPSMPPALFVLDGFPIGNDYSMIANMNPSDIYFITAIKSTYGFYLYGDRANGGVVYVETKASHFGGKYEIDDSYGDYLRGDLSRPVEIFRPTVEFYSPPEEDVKENPSYWLRSTIFWNPEVFYDGETPAVIKYFNHLKKGAAKVIINGVSFDNQPVTTSFSYMIR